MRIVRLTFGPGHVLVVATVLASGCGGSTESSPNTSSSGGSVGTGTASASGGASNVSVGTGGSTVGSGGASTISIPEAGGAHSNLCARPPEQLDWADCAAASGGAPPDYPYSVGASLSIEPCYVKFVVPVAPEGTPPTAKELCAARDTPVSAGWAARVTLTNDSQNNGTATGRVTLAPELAGATVTAVAITVAEHDSGLGNIEIGTVERQGDVFVFPLAFLNPTYDTARFPRVIVTAKLTLDCEGTPRTVVSTTALYRCEGPMNNPVWISSGDACGECAIICEMVASPIVPPVSATQEPLSQVIRAQVIRIGQYDSALLLQAQHDGGADRFTYEWDISGGRVLWQERDLLLWAPPPAQGEHLVQVSLLADDAAAIASTRLRSQPLGAG